MDKAAVLLTGGFGYVGARLARHLTETTNARIFLGSRKQQGLLEAVPSAAPVVMEWSSRESLRKACEGMTAIVHLAGADAKSCSDDPAGALEFNGVATARLVDAAVAAGVRRFIYMSTAHVYGSPLAGTITESMPTRSLHPYATSHRAGEDAVLYAAQRGKLEGVAIRLSNAFGAPLSDHAASAAVLLVNDVCRQSVQSRRIVLQSAGLQRRDFITMTDACAAICHLLAVDRARLGDGLFNVGSGWSPTVLEMAERVARCCNDVLGHRPEVHRPMAGAGDVTLELDYRVDKLLQSGFEFAAPVDREISETLKFYAAAAGKQA